MFRVDYWIRTGRTTLGAVGIARLGLELATILGQKPKEPVGTLPIDGVQNLAFCTR